MAEPLCYARSPKRTRCVAEGDGADPGSGDELEVAAPLDLIAKPACQAHVPADIGSISGDSTLAPA